MITSFIICLHYHLNSHLTTFYISGGEDYIFSLLTGYEPVPPGQKIPEEGQAYNPYIHDGYLAMAQQIYNESVDYEDGTIPYASQIAKDVSEYYSWAADPFINERKLWGMKVSIKPKH